MLQVLQENIWLRLSFLTKLQASGGTFYEIFKSTFFTVNLRETASNIKNNLLSSY